MLMQRKRPFSEDVPSPCLSISTAWGPIHVTLGARVKYMLNFSSKIEVQLAYEVYLEVYIYYIMLGSLWSYNLVFF